jgi:hypothetical protein
MLTGAIDLSGPAPRQPGVTKALVVTEIHVAAPDGRCAWCWDSAGVWTPHPCTVRRWADRVAMDDR